jgi:hypothetical protein
MRRKTKQISILQRTAQFLLSLLFLFAGGTKLLLPLTALTQGPIPLPGWFLRGIGVLEILGALGLVLPDLFRTRVHLVPIAAAGLVGIMAGATTLTAVGMGWVPALFPLGVGALAAFVCLGRSAALPGLEARAGLPRLQGCDSRA